ncbi:MAG TPA: sugar phosphate isomerase/epimerase family protein [Anaerolineales bacterium]|nr:sugar phosphate isomerase/epimerase family protein [Anaerolineales bacterium]
MKLSLDVIGYGGYFTKDNDRLSLEDSICRAASFGYDAACIFAHRPLGFPVDLNQDRRKKLVDLYKELDLEVGAIVCCNNFVDSNHVLVYNTEKEIMYTLQCIDLAADLGSKIVRVMASLWGYFSNPYSNQGYGLPAFESRSRRVSRGEDYLEAWHQVRQALTEVALYAQDKGITLALQTHPEITNNNDDTLEMLHEVGVDSLKVGVDLPLMEGYDPEAVRATVRKMAKSMVYSHTISLATIKTIGGAAYGWEEVTPGTDRDPLPWETFLKTCKEIGYDGLFSHEQCSPIVVKGHQLGTVRIIDERYLEARNFFRNLLKKLDSYTGNRPEYVEYQPELLQRKPEPV